MADYILDLLNANETVDYSFILSAAAAYVLFMWLIVCIWVFFDAKKRYKSILMPFQFTVFSLLFNLPALIFYIIIRPEHTLDEDYLLNLALSGEKQSKPIFFEGDKGFDISINLSVQPKENSDNKHKMDVDVSWMPKAVSSKSEVIEAKKTTKSIKFESLGEQVNRIKSRLKKVLLDIFGSGKNGESKKSKDEKKDKELDSNQADKEESKDDDVRKQKNKEKRRRKKKKKRKKN